MEYTEEKILKAKKYNAKIYPIYKMFSWDLLFYYSINFLFLTQVKSLTPSNVILLDGFFTLFKFIAQIPSISMAEVVGKRRSLIIANFSVTLSIIILLISRNLNDAIIANAFMGIGFSMKSLCEPIFLRDCITAKEHPGSVFTAVDGRGSSFAYLFDAITASFCGYIFIFHKYLPMLLCLSMCIISCLITLNFKSYEDPKKKVKFNKHGALKTYYHDLRIAFQNIFKSDRLKALFLFSGLFAAILAIRSTIASSLFHEIGIKEEYFGIILATLTLFSAIASRFPNIIHKKLKNRVLACFSLTFTASMIAIGLVSMFCHNFTVAVCSILVLYSVQYIIKGPYYTLLKKYLNSFSSETMSTRIYSANTLSECLVSVVMCYITSLFLNITSTAFTITFLGCALFITFIMILEYMQDRIGLKPEEYKKSDIYFTEVH